MVANAKTAAPKRGWVFHPFLVACGVIVVLAVLQWADRTWPPDLSALEARSFVVEDRNGVLLRAYATGEGRWRLPVDNGDVDPRFVKMLLAYEDKRFYSHYGVDGLALLRASGQLVRHGRIVSGGSTLTMQVARLLEGPQKRSFTVKLRQMVRAVQIERRLTKAEILNAYLTLAPYGGNIEGVRAASLAYFGKEPKILNPAEAALLVSLPQSPETRRPDRFAKRAMAARARVLDRGVRNGIVEAADGRRAKTAKVPATRTAMPALAAHLADRARLKAKGVGVWPVTIDAALQQRLEKLARSTLREMGAKQSVAILVADHKTGEILAQIGSPDFFNVRRSGEVDMTLATRSPGSTLKPFIYGLAFENGTVHPATLIEDVPHTFSGYRPRNFDLAYQGTVTVTKALQLSLNVPAIALLNDVGPDKLVARFRRAGVNVRLPKGEKVGLAIGLGGIGLSLRDLVQLYTQIPRGGRAIVLRDGVEAVDTVARQRALNPVAAWYVQKILSGVEAPDGARQTGRIGYKTGTSYGYRDAWSIGFDGRHVIGVWVGRPDGSSVPGITGRGTAAPILFDAFARISEKREQLASAPDGILRVGTGGLPTVLKRFTARGELVAINNRMGKPPVIVYPPQGARVDLGFNKGAGVMPLFLKMQGGKPPFRWIANGKPVLRKALRRRVQWQPDSPGFSTLTVLDAVGRAARVEVFVE